jgi:hypothetical protein
VQTLSSLSLGQLYALLYALVGQIQHIQSISKQYSKWVTAYVANQESHIAAEPRIQVHAVFMDWHTLPATRCLDMGHVWYLFVCV